ncbi:tetrahydrofolate dehydrogenase/cyclohydrolase catalytic domain-containing protein [Natrialba sp. PRR66]|uniref:tetrahydrofolate dehydrogenase/cyclohydrolase catalytic domain-containing protein n=1 Tax=Natrialba sp. PRR66 TaxID=3098146 RepID=UPI002B1DAEE3|nr:tetrahydrofolate dehydrogenase/cyclohydrolase catalytic domain-containing protein [Natrialba sp. PRR66]
MTRIIDGNEIADRITADLEPCLETLADAGVTPGLATVLMSDDGASETYVSMKRRACNDLGIESIHHELDPDAPADALFDRIDELNDDPAVHGILVQLPLPDHVDRQAVLERIDPRKDVDGFHPENVGRLVTGTPRFKPCTPHGIQKLLEAEGIETEGADVVIVGRSNIVGKPMANLLVQKSDTGNATVTICHSRTDDLAAKTRDADVVVAAAGVPELIDGSMLSPGTTVIDVGVNRVSVSERRSEDSQTSSDQSDTERGYELVGDVEFNSAAEEADAITPVPGGVGPLTITMLLYNTIKAASLQADVDVSLP